MSAPRLWVAVLISAAWSLASLASAQGTAGTSGTTSAGLIAVTPISIGSATASTLGKIYLNAADCENNVTLTFQLDGIPSGNPVLDIYLGEGCNAVGNRTSTVSTACTYVKSVDTGNMTQKFKVTLQATEVLPGCPPDRESVPKIWFLSVNTPKSTEDVGNSYGLFDRLNVDTKPPSAPSSLKGGEGGSVIPISWKSSETNIKGFVVFIDASGMSAGQGSTADAATATDASGIADEDAGGGDGGAPTRVSVSDGGTRSSGACGPTLLVANASPIGLPGAVRRRTLNERTASGVDIVLSDLGGASQASIAVSAVDLAGNQGPLSNVACVKVVPTSGFLERYRDNGGSAKAGCPCSAMGPAQLEEAWPVGLALLALGLSSRRRRLW